jgi:hypothetical protein
MSMGERERGNGRERGTKRERGLSFHLIPNIAAAAVVVEVARRVSTDQGAQSEYIARSPCRTDVARVTYTIR